MPAALSTVRKVESGYPDRISACAKWLLLQGQHRDAEILDFCMRILRLCRRRREPHHRKALLEAVEADLSLNFSVLPVASRGQSWFLIKEDI